MAGQGQGISVPISLQISNLQSIVNMLQSKLSNLKVGTAGFKSLQTIISTIQKDIDKLAIQTDKPFVSANQFTAADRAVNKLEEDLDKVQIAVSRIKFSDLELDPSQAAELKAFETQIESIKNSLKTVKETAKQAFLDSDVGKSWAENHKDAATQTLQQLTTTITKEVQKQTTELDQAKKAFSDYQQAIQTSKNINNFMSKRSGHQLSEATMGKELFNKIFKTGDTGEVSRFKSGGKTLLQQWLQQQFNLDSTTVQSLTKDAGDAVVKAFAEVGGTVEAALKAQQIKLRNAATEQKTATNNGSTLEAAVKEKTEKLNQTEAVQAQLVASNTSVSASEAQLRTELEQTKAQLADYKERLAQAVRTNPDWAASNKQASAALQQLRDTLNQTNGQFLQQQRVMSSFNSMKMAVVNFMGFNQVLNITRKAVREAINHIKELDTVMNGIAIVTDMSTGDLWTQIDQYSKMAQAYGVSITGAYEVSQIYYQQGLETADVMTLTNETLKLAKISGLDYATTTDYMTTAIRGFKMEMSEASTVVDVYSNLAAHTAVSQEELAVAMSKTASSMEGVGATFEEASAMIGTMVAVTRESATNIGSAMKSIASRYGELTKDPTKLVDEEGEAMAFNKVDAALQSVGISMKTVDGQFREFTDVIVELGEKWEQLDSTQQRYIATQFAGNRQQSRFLALVSNVDLLKSNLDVAMNSEDTGTLQALKALDSIESKIEQVKVAYQQFYTTIGAESIWKGLLDSTKNVINTLNGLPKLFGKIPIAAIGAISSVVSLIKTIGTNAIVNLASIIGTGLKSGLVSSASEAESTAENIFTRIINRLTDKLPLAREAGQKMGKEVQAGAQEGENTTNVESPQNKKELTKQFAHWINLANTYNTDSSLLTSQQQLGWTTLAACIQDAGVATEKELAIIKKGGPEAVQTLEQIKQRYIEVGASAEASTGKIGQFFTNHAKGIGTFGQALNMTGLLLKTTSSDMKIASGALMGVGGAFQFASLAAQGFKDASGAIPWMAIVSAVFSVINGISQIINSFSEDTKLEELTEKAEELSNKAKEAKAEYRTLDNSVKKLDELNEKRYESAEAAEEYQAAVDDLAEKFPQLIISFDNAGNAIIDETNATNLLAEARKKSAEAAIDAAKGEIQRIKQEKVTKRSSLKSKASDLRVSLNDYQDDEGNFSRNIQDLEQALADDNYNWASEDATDLFNAVVGSYNTLKKKYEDRPISFEKVDSYFNQLISGIPDLNSFLPKIQGQERIMISAWQETQTNNGLAWDYLTQSANSAALVTKAIEKTFADHGDYEINDANYDIIVKQWKKRDYMAEMNNFWLELGLIDEDYQKKFDEMLSDSSNYTTEDFEKVFGKIDGFKNIESMLTAYYTDNLTTIQKRIQKRIEQLTKDESGNRIEGKGRYDEINIRTFKNLTEEKYLNKLINSAEDLDNRGLDNYANNIITQGLDLFDAIEKLNGDTQKALYKVIFENGFSSVDGLQAIIDYINNTETITDKDALIGHLKPMLKYTISNINLSMQAATSNILETFEDTSKELGKAMSGGFDLTEADALISKAHSLGLDNWNLDTFIQSGDKLLLTAEATEEYWKALNKSNEDARKSYKKKIQSASILARRIASSGTKITKESITDRQIKIFEEIGFNWEDYFDRETRRWKNDTNDVSVQAFNNALQAAIALSRDNLADLTKTWEIAEKIMKKSWDYQQGNYGKSIEELEQIAQEISFDRTTQEGADRKAIHDSLNEAYNNLISDVLSKGFNNIDLSDYSGLINDAQMQATLEAAIKEGNYVEFVQEYVKFATNSIDEANNLIVQAIEKDQAKTSSSLLNDVQFRSPDLLVASLGALENLASAYGKNLGDLLTNAQREGEDYILSISTLIEQGLDITQIDGFSDQVKDGVAEFFSKIVSLLENGLKGSLSSADATNLKKYASSIGFNGELDFTETVNGLKLADQSAIQLQAHIASVNRIAGQTSFKVLNESLQETNEYYTTVSANMARIVELQEIIAKADDTVSEARLKEYQQELKVAKDILSVRSATEEDDTFKFMENDIPGAQKNPLNFYENWGKAIGVIQESAKTGYMSFQDWRNIITEINNEAALAGTTIEFAGFQLDGKMESAAKAIQAGAGSLSVTTDGSLKVDFSQMGINFKAGADKMMDSVDDGVKAYAKAQVKMLDSLIAMLEVVVAMQEIDLDIDDDNKISFGEIFDVDGSGEIRTEVQQWMNLLTSSFDIKVGEKNLAQALIEKLNPEQLGSFFNELYQIINNPEVDPATLPSQLQELIKKYFPEEAIEVGEGALAKLSIDADTYKDGLYNKIKDAVKEGTTLNDFQKKGLIAEITKVNKELGNILTTLLKSNSNITVKDALTIAAIVSETGNITYDEESKKYNVSYPGYTGGPFETEEAAIQDLTTFIQGTQILPNQEITAKGTQIIIDGDQNKVIKKLTFKDGSTKCTFNGVTLTIPSNSSLSDAEIENWFKKNASTSSIPDTINGEAVTLTEESTGSVNYDIVYDAGAGKWYVNGQEIGTNLDASSALKKYLTLKSEGEEESAAEPLSTTIPHNEPIQVTYTYNGIKHQLLITDLGNGNFIDQAGNKIKATNINDAAKQLVESQYSMPETVSNTSENPLSYTWVYNGVAFNITIGENGTYNVNGKEIAGASSPTEAIQQGIAQGVLTLDLPDLNATQKVNVTTDYEYSPIEKTVMEMRQKLAGAHKSNNLGREDSYWISPDIANQNKTAIGAYTQELNNLANSGKVLSSIDLSNLKHIAGTAELGNDIRSLAKGALELATTNEKDLKKNIESLETLSSINPDGITDLIQLLSSLSSSIESLGQVNVDNIDIEKIKIKIQELFSALVELKDETDLSIIVDISDALKTITDLLAALDGIKDKTVKVTTEYQSVTKSGKTIPAVENSDIKAIKTVDSTGNLGLARAKGTLMGELGPELVVSNGRYFVAGQDGPEMIDLADDAIVFNHLQTEQLLKNGMSNERGRAVTNERVAAAFAHGNVNGGPAMASASAALATLKQLRSMWQSLLNASVKDFAGAGGGGGGGGGNTDDIGNFVKELEKWYNWLQEIAELEEQINYQEKLRSKIQSDMIPHGQDIATSYMTSLDALEKEIAVQEDLRNAQQEYFDQRRAWMNSNQNPFSSLYTFDENGQLKYANGKLEELSNMVGRNEEGKANYDAKEQYEMIQAMGYGDFLKYDSSGNEIELYQKDENGEYKLDEKGEKMVNADAYTTAVQAFWDKIDADKEEMQSLHDSINEHRDAVLEKQQAMNEILKSIEDNQIAVENKVLDAMVDSREREIEESEKERAAIEKSSQSLIKGLSDQLNKERAMYEQQQDKNELNSLQRRLGILQRSGGSASEIASLQEQISQKQQDSYFEAQQNQIDALQEASDNELARLDAQIELAKETLEYEKTYGLLWQKVSEELAKSPTEIAQYIKDNNSDYWGKSRTDLAQTMREDLMEAQEFKKIQENFDVIAAYYKAFDDAANAGAKGKWTQDEQGRWQYQKANGDLAKNSWEKVDDKWYRFDENGYMQTGWVKDQDQWYHLDEKSGAMDTSWFHDKDDKWYYLDETSGAMLSNTTKQLMWNGEKANHSFDETGAWTGSTPIEKKEEEEKEDQNEENSSNENKKYKVTYKITGTSGDLSPNNTTGYGIGDTEEEARNNAQYYAKKKASGIANAKITYSDPVEYGSGSQTDSTSTDMEEEENQEGENNTQNKYKASYDIYDEKGNKTNLGGFGVGNNPKQAEQAAEALAKQKIGTSSGYTYHIAEPQAYSEGGLNNYTGLALLHGSPSKPEAVLTSEQTSTLRNEILGNRNDSLLSLLTDFREAWSETKNAYSSITRDSSVVIEHAEVNMNVESIDNDYGAQRAGEQALNQMMQIARKTQAQNRVS